MRPLLFALVFLLLTVALSQASTPAVPDTPAGHVFSAWLSAFNSGNKETERAYLAAHRPAGLPQIDQILAFRQTNGGYDLKEITSSTPNALAAVLEDRRNEQFYQIDFSIDPARPAIVSKIDVNMIPAPAEFAVRRASDAKLIAATRPRIVRDVADGLFSGAVLIAKNGVPIFEQAYGLADRAHKTPNTLDTRFHMASMDKMFTAVAIMQLARSGKLQLSDSIAKFVPDYPNRSVAAVTIEQLLTHTGGTGDIFTPDYEKHRLAMRTLDDYVTYYGSRGVAFKPGSRFEYSNYGYILLGLIIERASGQSYYAYVHDHIFAPAGMMATGFEPEAAPVPNRAVGYTKMGGPLQPNTDALGYRGSSAGGGYSTVDDLLRFANALESNTLLDARSTELMTTRKVDGDGLSYGYGFSVESIAGTRCFGHNGGGPGQGGDLIICPQLGYVVALLTNMDPFPMLNIRNFITSRIGGS